jgi:hypothetical protein
LGIGELLTDTNIDITFLLTEVRIMPKHHEGGSVEGRSRAFPTAIRNLIVNWATEDKEHCNLDRNRLAIELIEEIKKRGEIPPTEDTLIAMISTARSHSIEKVDHPWSMSTLREGEFPLLPDVVPFVVKVQQRQKDLPPLGVMTIRQAQWISRLCKVMSNIDDLAIISWHYALYERVAIKAKTTFDTTKPDSVLPDRDKVVESFHGLLDAADFKAIKPVFESMTGQTLSENEVVFIDTIWLGPEGVAAVTKVACRDNEGHKFYNHIILKYLGAQSKVLPQLINLGAIKKKNYPTNVYVNLKKTVAIEMPREQLSKFSKLKSLDGNQNNKGEGASNG